MAASPLVVDRPGNGVVRLRLDRGERRNALDMTAVEALHDAVAGRDVPVAVLGSTEPGVFCAGADLELPDAERAAVSDRLYALYARMREAGAVLIAAIDGAAVGGGAQLALACDVRVAGGAARLRFPGPGHGLAVGAWGLPSLVGRGRAMELCLSMRWVEADEALRIGLVDRLAGDAAAEALAFAEHVAALEPDAVRRVKRVVAAAGDPGAALELEAGGNRAAWSGSVEGLVGARG